MRKAGLLGGLIWLALACRPESADIARPVALPSRYFALNAFLEMQAQQLNLRKSRAVKQVRLRSGQTATTLVPQLDWTKELQIFQQADITKPALRDSYVVDSTRVNDLVYYRYQRRAEVEYPVRQLTVSLRGKQVVTVEAVVTQDNPLVYSRKTMQLRTTGGQLASYQVAGVQKLLLFDSVRYVVKSRVN